MSAIASLQQRVAVPTTRSSRRMMCAPLRATNEDLRKTAKDAVSDVGDQLRKTANEVGDKLDIGNVGNQARNAVSDMKNQAEDAKRQDMQGFYAPTPELEKPSFNASNPNQYPVGFGAISELANSRLSMLGITAALAAEVATGKSVWEQITYSPLTTAAIAATFVAFIIATYVPASKGAKLAEEQNGPFTPIAELTNGRWAMVGWVALLVTEGLKGGALIGA